MNYLIMLFPIAFALDLEITQNQSFYNFNVSLEQLNYTTSLGIENLNISSSANKHEISKMTSIIPAIFMLCILLYCFRDCLIIIVELLGDILYDLYQCFFCCQQKKHVEMEIHEINNNV